MKVDPRLRASLNTVLTATLTAINQHFLHARLLGHWGFEGLEARVYAQSIRAMKDADTLIERILFLEGLPNLQRLGKILIGETAPECLACDRTMQEQHLATLRGCIAECEAHEDYVSRELLVGLLESGEAYLDWLETEQGLIEALGEAEYLQARLGD